MSANSTANFVVTISFRTLLTAIGGPGGRLAGRNRDEGLSRT
jgi:hypothetical protein